MVSIYPRKEKGVPLFSTKRLKQKNVVLLVNPVVFRVSGLHTRFGSSELRRAEWPREAREFLIGEATCSARCCVRVPRDTYGKRPFLHRSIGSVALQTSGARGMDRTRHDISFTTIGRLGKSGCTRAIFPPVTSPIALSLANAGTTETRRVPTEIGFCFVAEV